MRRWHAFLQLSWQRKLFIFELLLWLILARLAVLVLPRRTLLSFLKKKRSETMIFFSDQQVSQARLAGRWIGAWRGIVPWMTTCLSEALAGRWALGRRNISSSIVLGVKKNEKDQLEAHAWLQCGDTTILGGEQAEQFKPIARLS